jgi:ATP-dependent Clp protease protease subunit
MPHIEPSGGASGQATDIAIHAKEIIRIRERLTAIYVSSRFEGKKGELLHLLQQKHCGREAESVDDGLKRFGKSLTLPV